MRTDNYRECCVNKRIMKQKIDEISFIVDDIILYLDTHPYDEKAFEYYEDMAQKRKELMVEYAKNFGPIVKEDGIWGKKEIWAWSQQPFPWEKEGGR